jgi:N-acetylglucosaminyldiphosphoundecaprenol N-acetyl-beta-D-mannosaminyltransferase
MHSRNLLGVNVCATDYAEACDTVRRAATLGQRLTVTALAVHGVMTGALDETHRRRLNALDVVLPDGQPVRWGLNLLFGDGLRDRVCGPELMLQVCRMCASEGLPIAFYGNRPEVLAQLSGNLTAQFPDLRIAAAIPSQFRRVSEAEQAAIAGAVQRSGAKVVFVGLGCPRQEVWLYENRNRLQMPMLAVGAAFDFHADRLAIAPRWMQDSGLEWSYRLAQEPRRLWRRYLLLNPLYLLMLAAQKLRLRRVRPGTGNAPALNDDPISFEGYA